MDTTITRISPLIVRHTTTIDGPVPVTVSVDHLDLVEVYKRIGRDERPWMSTTD